MKIDEKLNGGPLPYNKSICPAELRGYTFALGLGPQLASGEYECFAWAPKDKPKHPVQVFLFNADAASGKYRIVNSAHSNMYLSANAVVSPLDCLFGAELEAKLEEMFRDGYAAWN
ncbi:MAG: hypothetical protein J6Q59_04140 [Paludibacteraceae bacterium]|nr:hypothetical protein [Paludibacteraceae bacterium]